MCCSRGSRAEPSLGDFAINYELNAYRADARGMSVLTEQAKLVAAADRYAAPAEPPRAEALVSSTVGS